MSILRGNDVGLAMHWIGVLPLISLSVYLLEIMPLLADMVLIFEPVPNTFSIRNSTFLLCWFHP